MLRVDDVLFSLQELARKTLIARKTKIIAITGSLGKTTTKEFLSTLLSKTYKVFANPESYNSKITLPLSILMAEGDEDYLILEMGMTHPGDLARLVSIAPPDIALLTTVAVQHANNFSDGLEGIAKEKATIFSAPKTTVGFYHHDIPHVAKVIQVGSCPQKSFSLITSEADFFATIEEKKMKIFENGKEAQTFTLDFPLLAFYQNFLGALTVARSLNISWQKIAEALPNITLPPMRFERVESQGILFINDAYNANPDAMKVALESIPQPKQNRKKIAVLSEMDALGMYSVTGHKLVAEAALQNVDHLLCVGANCETMREVWEREKTV